MIDTKDIVFLLLFVFGVALFPLMYNEVLTVDTSAWSFMGADFIIAFLPAIPFIWIIFLISLGIYKVWSELG